MGRILSFLISIRIVMLLIILVSSDAGCMTVHDPISFAKASQTAANSVKTLNGITEMSGKIGSVLQTANKSFRQLSTMNSVLGGPLSNSTFKKLSSLGSSSRKYGGLLRAFTSTMEGKSSGLGLNYAAHKTLGTPNLSKYIRTKNFVERKYFQATGERVHTKKAKNIRRARERAARRSVVNTIAISKTHQENLSDDHIELEKLAKEAASSGDMNHQILIQTKLLERIAQNQEKLILLQSQQLDFMAKTYLGDRGVDPRDENGKTGGSDDQS